MPAPDQEERVWGMVAMELPEGLDGEITARLGTIAIGSESSPAAHGNCSLRIYTRSPQQAARAVALLERLLGEAGLEAQACAVRAHRVADGRWAERYQASLKPFAIGSRFEVHPDGVRRGRSALLPLLLVPGRAFGTGQHATTRLCVEMLERHVRRGGNWLDLGCGSALLAMVAHHCGAARVLALDSDAEAIEVARAVLAANGLSRFVELRHGTLEGSGGGPWEGIVANISAQFSISSAGRLYSGLAPGGVLIVSGFSRQEAGQVARALAASGFRSAGRRAEGEWSAVVAAKPAGGGR